MREKIEYKDLKENEIYFCSYDKWNRDYIQRYNKGSHSSCVGIDKGSGELVFAYSGCYSAGFYGVVGFYQITDKERKWYEDCYKANKLVELIKEEVINNFKYY